jgi:hypothetical protein
MIPSYMRRYPNIVLLVLGLGVILDGWFAKSGADPGKGAIIIALVLLPRAIAMGPQSVSVMVLGCALSFFAFAGNAGILPGGNFKMVGVVCAFCIGLAIIFWERLVGWWRLAHPSTSPK